LRAAPAAARTRSPYFPPKLHQPLELACHSSLSAFIECMLRTIGFISSDEIYFTSARREIAMLASVLHQFTPTIGRFPIPPASLGANPFQIDTNFWVASRNATYAPREGRSFCPTFFK